MKRQLAFLCARAQVPIEWLQDEDEQEEMPEDLLECLSNIHLSTHFKDFGKELGVLDSKSLEDIYKSHLENTRKPFPALSISQAIHLCYRICSFR